MLERKPQSERTFDPRVISLASHRLLSRTIMPILADYGCLEQASIAPAWGSKNHAAPTVQKEKENRATFISHRIVLLIGAG